MILKVAQVSDIHVRVLKYHSEYRRVFQDLYSKLEIIKPDIIVNTGDLVHTKTNMSPELVQMVSEFLRELSRIAPVHSILGNHDLNLTNQDRQDAITPIVESIKNPRVVLHKKSGLSFTFEKDGQKFNFWTFSLADQENYPRPSSWAAYPNDVNIGLFHGSVSTCITDLNWKMTVEHDLSIFDGLDFALLGDIHKQQFFRDRTIAYPGSLIQQNFGEETDKGFLLWNFGKKGEQHEVSPYILRGSRKFHTIKLNEDLSIPELNIEPGSRVRISPQTSITLAQQKEIEGIVKKLYKPYDVITLSSANIGMQKTMAGKNSVDIENLRSLPVQEKLIKDFLAEKKLDDNILQKVLDLNRKFQLQIEQGEDTERNIRWKLNSLVWSNFFNYGGNNTLDMSLIPGLTGIFAPNGSGKSNLIDIILETCFDATTKGINKNIHLINDNKDTATAIADITVNDQNYIIERTIDRIKYGQKKFEETKEWGKTTVNFSAVDDAGGLEPLVGTLRPETERNIRQRIGTYDDFLLTSLSAQWNPMDIIANKETKRKEIFYKFFNLDIFEEKGLLAKSEDKEFSKQLSDLEDSGIEDVVRRNRISIESRINLINEKQEELSLCESDIRDFDDKIISLTSQKVQVEKSFAGVPSWASQIKKADDHITTNRLKLSELEPNLGVVEIDLGKVLKLEQRFDLKMHEDKEKLLQDIQQDIVSVDRKIRDLNLELKTIQAAAEELGEVTCPKCDTIIQSLDSSQKIQLIHSKLVKLTVERAIAIAQRDDLLPDVERLNTYRRFMGEKESLNSKRDNLKLQIENIRLKIESLEVEKTKALEDKAKLEKIELDIEKNVEIDKSVLALQKEKSVKNDKIQDIQDEIVELNRLMGGEQSVLEKLSTQLVQLQDLRDTCSAYEYYGKAMGKDGIAYNILTQKLPLLNEEINKILSNAADFTVFIEHDNEEQSIRFYIQYGQYKRRLLELGSGAEKFLSSIAIRTALLNISNLPKTNMFIIDEGFGKLDPKNIESVQRMFDYLKTVFDHVIVISHLDSLKDMVDNIIEFTADEEGYAHINIGG